MRTGPRLRVLLIFALMALGNVAVVWAGLFLAARRSPEMGSALATAGIVASFGTLLVTVLVWLLFDDAARKITGFAAALRARAHGGVTDDLDIAALHPFGDLAPASGALCRELARMQTEFDTRVENATRAVEEENTHLAALLSDIPVAIMLVDASNRVMLYDRQCVHALGQVATLGLGRSVHDYLDRDGLDAARADLATRGEAKFVDATLATADGTGTVRARLRPALQGHGFMLAIEVEDEAMAERPLVFDFDLTDKVTDRQTAEMPLSALTFVVFDLETTGLDTRQDEIVQIGAVRVLGNRLVRGETFETLVNPGRPIPPGSSRIHGVTDELVIDAPDPVTALRRLHGFAREAVLVAHNAPFDLAFLRRHERELGLAFDNLVLDTVLLSAIVYGQGETHTLDAIADRLCVRIDGAARHTAAGDALATAQVLVRLLPVLEARGIRTFGEVTAAMRRHARLLPDLNQPPR